MMYCYNCGQPAEQLKKFQDPRRGHGDNIVYVERVFCTAVCEEDICDKLEREAQYARLVH